MCVGAVDCEDVGDSCVDVCGESASQFAQAFVEDPSSVGEPDASAPVDATPDAVDSGSDGSGSDGSGSDDAGSDGAGENVGDSAELDGVGQADSGDPDVQILPEDSTGQVGEGAEDNDGSTPDVIVDDTFDETGGSDAGEGGSDAPSADSSPVVDVGEGDGEGEADGAEGESTGPCGIPSFATPNTWTAVSSVGAPSARRFPAAAWTGKEILVWGGLGWNGEAYVPEATGARYNPKTDTWSPMSNVGAPSARHLMAYAWTGSKLFVWGGTADPAKGIYQLESTLTDGALYDPETDSWQPTSLLNAPSGRVQPLVLVVGGDVFIWAGLDPQTGKAAKTGRVYSPDTDTWAIVTLAGAPPTDMFPSGFVFEDLVYVGEPFLSGVSNSVPMAYDPASDTWSPGMLSGATRVWKLGDWFLCLRDAAQSSPKILQHNVVTKAYKYSDTALPAEGADTGDYHILSSWNGAELVLWGGTQSSTGGVENVSSKGVRYHPVFHALAPMPTEGAPLPTSFPARADLGNGLFVWGGSRLIGGADVPQDVGAIYWHECYEPLQ
jgi:hypothetical protein